MSNLGKNLEVNSFPERLKIAKNRANCRTDKDFADLIDVSKSTVSAYFKGLQFPRPDVLERIAKKTGVDEEWLRGTAFSGPEPNQTGLTILGFDSDLMASKANFWALFLLLRTCRGYFEQAKIVPTLQQVFEWVGPNYRQASELEDIQFEFKFPEKI